MAKNTLGGFVAGAMVMYFADPNRGRRRRALARDKFVAGCHDVTHEIDKGVRDLWNRMNGIGSSVACMFDRNCVDKTVLEQRVRSAIGRVTSHPRAIRVRAESTGRVILEGPVLRDEVNELFEKVNQVPGVKQVASRLEIYIEPSGVPALQGGTARRELSEIAQQNWTPALRLATGAIAGAALYTSVRRKGPLAWLIAAGGTALLTRTLSNRPLRQIIGMEDSADVVHVDKAIHVNAPVEEVYAYWSDFENFPKFMAHLKEVRRLENGRTHWVAAGPAGVSIPWDADITEQRENQCIGWRSIPGSLIHTSGVVRFDRENGGTRVGIRMSYCPPAGMVGHAAAKLFGADPKSEIDDDLIRFKSLIEIGKTRAHGNAITRQQLPALRHGAGGSA